MMLNRGMLSWSHRLETSLLCLPSYRPRDPRTHEFRFSTITSSVSSVDEGSISGRERRQMRNDRRESKNVYNWKEDVETRLIKKTKKRRVSWTEELNLDNLASLGPQWWIVRVSRVSGNETSERMARALARSFPHIDFKVYIPSVQIKKKLKNGSITVKPKSVFPGCVFLRCIMNKELHDFIRECDGVGGFVGSKVGNEKRQINKPRPVSADEVEAIFKQAKEEQQKADLAFEEEQKRELASNSTSLIPGDITDLKAIAKRGGRVRKTTSLKLGSTVQVISGSFAGFTGTIKKLDKKARVATLSLMLFGKETLADINTSDISPETNQQTPNLVF